jgi:hypothetical protein
MQQIMRISTFNLSLAASERAAARMLNSTCSFGG